MTWFSGGCFYGPYLYLSVTIGGLYVAGLSPNSVDQKLFQSFPADFLLIWSLNRRSDEGKFLCDFSSQKVWILLWQVMNILGVCGLVVALGE